MKRIIFLSVALLVTTYCIAQKLHLPLEFKRAYDKGTRSYDGKAGPAYWQNSASYDIRVSVDPATKLLEGAGTVSYTSNSPDSVRRLVLQAYHNYYKPGSRKAGFFAPPVEGEDHEGMVMDEISINGQSVDLSNDDEYWVRGTQVVVELAQPMATGETISIDYKWHYVIPGEGFERSGAIDSTSMFVAYWYPEVAVMDDIHGWDYVTYDASAEFYHDVSDFRVEVEVPSNFVVWSSAPLANSSEVLPSKLSDRLEEARLSKEPVTIVGKKDLNEGIEMRSNVWKFEINDVPDFAFALSDHFIWEAASYEDEMGKYFLNIAYDPDNPGFSTVLKGQQTSLNVFHTQFPKHPFPYNHFTIFNGLQGGGMEFPGMANDEAYSAQQFSNWMGYEVSDYQANLGVTLHEMYHMYFPFMMGINEKRYAWMDEGWADFADHFSPEQFESSWDNEYLTRHWVVPMMVPTYTRPNHSGINSYTMGAYSYYSLYYLLGEERFDECMAAYIDRWKGKHPTPYDYFFTFNDVSGQDLNWFWKAWYFDFGYPDLKNDGLQGNTLTISNEGGRPLAFQLIYTYEDDSEETEMISPECWKEGETFTKEIANPERVVSIQLKSLGGTDVLYSNNTWTRE